MSRFQRLASRSLIALLALQSCLQAASLPTGGTFTAGAGNISNSGNVLTINQSSLRGIIDWNTFSIGNGASVTFNNGAGATLNRVTGGAATAIFGQLHASGTVYLINPQGILIGNGAAVHTGGDFLASTLNIANSAFLNSGSLVFSGPSKAAVVNLGNITSTGGNVYLIGHSVRNGGTINTPNGTAGLGAGSQVLIADSESGQHVFVQAPGGDVTNSGFINAAQAELKSNGGNIYALAGNNGGQIRATGTAAKDGHVYLIAEGGTTNVSGLISARNANGAGGTIETSGAQVHTAGATIATGRGGSWLLDPDDLTIDSGLASTIQTSLNGGTNVTEQTSAPTSGGNGDITVASDIAWNSGASLTLSAYRNIGINSGVTISNTGAGNLTLRADKSSNGTGAVNINGLVDFSASTGNVAVLYDPAGPASTKYTAPVIYSASQIKTNSGWAAPTDGSVSSQSTAYMLVNNVTDLQNVNTNLSGTYALGTDVDAGSVANFIPIARTNPNYFTGIFDGQGRTISNLTINDTTSDTVGLFGFLLGKVRNVNLTNESVTSSSAIYVGGLVGAANGTVSNANVAGTVTSLNSFQFVGGLLGTNGNIVQNSSANVAVNTTANWSGFTGGLVGQNNGSISNSYAAGSVTLSSLGNTTMYGGGLVGYNGNVITGSYATGAVSVGASDSSSFSSAGGLAGYSNGFISDSYATGAVTGASNVYTGGFVGFNSASITSSYAAGSVNAATPTRGGGLFGFYNAGALTSSYWDSQATSQSNAAGNFPTLTGANSQTTAQLQSGTLPAGFSSTSWITAPGIYPLLAWQGKVVSGNVFDGASPLGSVTVDGLVNGINVGNTTTDAGGFYKFIALNSAFSAGPGVLTYLVGSNQGLTFSDGDGAGGYTGMNIYTDTLSLLNRTNSKYSGIVNAFAQALGGIPPSNLSLNNIANVSIDNGNLALALDQPISLANGTLQIHSQGDVTQSQPISVSGLSLSGNGNYSLNNTANNIGTLAANTNGDVSVTNSSALTIGTVGSTAGVSAGGSVLVNTAGDLTIAPGSTVTGSGSGDAVVLATGGTFTNLEGSGALNVSSGGGRWLVYSQNPANDTRGGLAYDFKQYNAAYGRTPAQTTGNGFLYTYAPTLTVGLTGTVGKTYDGGAATSLTSDNYTVSGAVDGDTVTLANTPGAGAYSDANAGSGKTVSAAISLANVSISNGSAAVYGYQLGSSTAAGSIGTINPATLTYTSDSASRAAGTDNPVFTGTIVGFVNNESLAAATTGTALFSTAADVTSAAGSYAINGSGLTANHGNYLFTQAPSNATALTVAAADIAPPPSNPPPPPPPSNPPPPPPAPTVLTLTVNSTSRLQDQLNPSFTATYSGPAMQGLDIHSLLASPAYRTAASTTSAAGVYQVAASVTAPSGFAVNVIPGTLTVIDNSPRTNPPAAITANPFQPAPLPASSSMMGNALQPSNALGMFQIGVTGLKNGFIPSFAGCESQQTQLARSFCFCNLNDTGATYFAGAKP